MGRRAASRAKIQGMPAGTKLISVGLGAGEYRHGFG